MLANTTRSCDIKSDTHQTRRRGDARTQAYLEKRTAQGLSPRDINRCLKRYIARELYRILKAHSTA